MLILEGARLCSCIGSVIIIIIVVVSPINPLFDAAL